jgi:hypothetical protein
MNQDNITIEDLETNETDVLVSYSKGIAGAFPFIGAFFGEMIGTFIPNQRVDRITQFLEILDRKLQEMGENIETLKDKMSNESFLNLFEEASWQSVKSSSKERKEYLSSILVNGLNDESLEEIQKNIFLNILSELNDLEILILFSHTWKARSDESFFKNNEKVLMGPRAYISSTQEEIDRETLHKTYKGKLVRLNLLKLKFTKPKKGEFPDFDEKTGMIKASGYEITSLGSLFLKYIDMLGKEEM